MSSKVGPLAFVSELPSLAYICATKIDTIEE
jgi:hypothetical protein